MKNLSNRDQVRVVIFDCDGVMFDSRAANIAFYDRILEHFEKPPVAPAEGDMVHMCTAEHCVDYFFQDDPRLEQAHQYRRNLRYEEFVPLMKREPYLEEALDALHRFYHLAIATNRTRTIHSILSIFHLGDYFDLVVCAQDVEHPKPDPEGLKKILHYFEAACSEAVYIGDTVVDQDVSARAEVPFVAYRNPGLAAEVHVQGMRDVLQLLADGEVPGEAGRWRGRIGGEDI